MIILIWKSMRSEKKECERERGCKCEKGGRCSAPLLIWCFRCLWDRGRHRLLGGGRCHSEAWPLRHPCSWACVWALATIPATALCCNSATPTLPSQEGAGGGAYSVNATVCKCVFCFFFFLLFGPMAADGRRGLRLSVRREAGKLGSKGAMG